MSAVTDAAVRVQRGIIGYKLATILLTVIFHSTNNYVKTIVLSTLSLFLISYKNRSPESKHG